MLYMGLNIQLSQSFDTGIEQRGQISDHFLTVECVDTFGANDLTEIRGIWSFLMGDVATHTIDEAIRDAKRMTSPTQIVRNHLLSRACHRTHVIPATSKSVAAQRMADDFKF